MTAYRLYFLLSNAPINKTVLTQNNNFYIYEHSICKHLRKLETDD